MSNLTITIDHNIEEGAPQGDDRRNIGQSGAAEIPRIVCGGSAEQAAALDDLMEISRRARSRRSGAKRWSREELHERE